MYKYVLGFALLLVVIGAQRQLAQTATPTTEHHQQPAAQAHPNPATPTTHPQNTTPTTQTSTTHTTTTTGETHDQPHTPTENNHPTTQTSHTATETPHTTESAGTTTTTDHASTGTPAQPTPTEHTTSTQKPVEPVPVREQTTQATSHGQTGSPHNVEITHQQPSSNTIQQNVVLNNDGQNHNISNDPIVNQIFNKIGDLTQQQRKQQIELQNKQRQIVEKEQQQRESQLSPWILDEVQRRKQSDNDHVWGERFEFNMLAGEVLNFYYDATTNKPNNDIHMDVYVYVTDQTNRFSSPNNPPENSFIGFTVTTQNHRMVFERKVYVGASFDWRPPTQGGYDLSFHNQYPADVFIIVNIQRLNKVVNAVNNSHIDPIVQQLRSVFEEMQQSLNEDLKSTYKSEMGFKEKEEEHQSTMLMLTGLELLAIVCTTMVQLYCLRSLLDRTSIV